jgi:hypothetical protein
MMKEINKSRRSRKSDKLRQLLQKSQTRIKKKD